MEIYYGTETEMKEIEGRLSEMKITATLKDIKESEFKEESETATKAGVSPTPLICIEVNGEKRCVIGLENLRKMRRLESNV